MKKIISLLFIAGLLFAACNPMNDIYDEIDAKEITFSSNQAITLTKADYESIGGNVKSKLYFSATDPAAQYIPAFLAKKYPAFTKGSIVNVSYDYYNGYPSYTNNYKNATVYSLTDNDYKAASNAIGAAKYFSPMNPADQYLPGVLAKSITGVSNGSVYLVKYKYSDINPVAGAGEIATLFEFDFASDLGGFTKFDAVGAQFWGWSSYSGDGFAKISGYSSGNKPNEDWLISPEIDLSGYMDATVNVNQTAKFVNGQWDQLQVLVSSNYNGTDPTTATWTTLNITTLPTGSDYTFVKSGDIDISAFSGKKICVAFKYISSSTNAATWEISDITVKGAKSIKSAIIINPIVIEELYTYNSGWKKTTEAYYVTSIDYDAMGAPGKYDNFSSTDIPGNYLPQLLEQKFPYVLEGTKIVAVYKYYSTSLGTRTDEYTLRAGKWTVYNPISVQTDQFINTGTSGWVFDPTVVFTMSSSDFLTIVNYIKANKASYIDSYGTAEFYYGASSFYSNFDLRAGKYYSGFSTGIDGVKEAIGKVLLPAKFPTAITQVSGIDVEYAVSFVIYDGTTYSTTMTFKCTKAGPNPEFTFVK